MGILAEAIQQIVEEDNFNIEKRLTLAVVPKYLDNRSEYPVPNEEGLPACCGAASGAGGPLGERL